MSRLSFKQRYSFRIDRFSNSIIYIYMILFHNGDKVFRHYIRSQANLQYSWSHGVMVNI